jgi:citrate lyase subunit beta / citryl-CoA lyase
MRSFLILQERDARSSQALTCGARAVAFDLRQARAFESALHALSEARRLASPPALLVRLAASQSDHADAALEALLKVPPDGVFLDGAEGGASVQHFGAKLAVFEARANLLDGALAIVAAAAGTPASALRLQSFVGCSPRLKALAFARDELAAALRVDADSAPVQEARSLLVLAAAAAAAQALDAPCSGDEAQLRKECAVARREGLAGKLTHRACEISVIEEFFGPRPVENRLGPSSSL